MSRSLYEPTQQRAISTNRAVGKDTRQRPFASTWVHPINDADCPPTEGDPHPLGSGYEVLTDWHPCLLNDWLQVDPSDENLEPFAFRIHYDGSLEFKGHLDASGGAVSGTVAFILPGMNNLEPDYVAQMDNTQMWDTVITDDLGVTFQIALVKIDADNGEVTISWPAA